MGKITVSSAVDGLLKASNAAGIVANANLNGPFAGGVFMATNSSGTASVGFAGGDTMTISGQRSVNLGYNIQNSQNQCFFAPIGTGPYANIAGDTIVVCVDPTLTNYASGLTMVGRLNTVDANSSITILGHGCSVTGGGGVSNTTVVGTSSSSTGSTNFVGGYQCTQAGTQSTSIGYQCDGSGTGSLSLGHITDATANYALAVGKSCAASGTNSGAVGYQAKTTVANTFELGYWSSASARNSTIRLGGGQVAHTVVNSASAPTDGGATAGSEAAGNLPRGMWAIRRNGLSFILDYNDGGTVKSLTLGTVV